MSTKEFGGFLFSARIILGLSAVGILNYFM